MIDKYKNRVEESGVSPVIGVILLVAVTVALVALATVIVFDLGDDVSNTADVTLDVSEKNDGVDVTVVRNENVVEMRVLNPDGSSESFSADVGTNSLIQGESGSYNVVAVLEDGSEETVRTVTISEDNAVETESGIVLFNPPAEGVLVQSIDEGGSVVDEYTTDSDGYYEVDKADSIQINNEYTADIREEGNIDLNVVADEESTTVQEILLNGEGTEESPYRINFASDLQVMNEDLDAHYVLNSDIDASGTENWNPTDSYEQTDDAVDGEEIELDFVAESDTISVLDYDDGTEVGFTVNDTNDTITIDDADYTDNARYTITYDTVNTFNQGFDPIVDIEGELAFTGELNGDEYEIDGLYINRPSTPSSGLIGFNEGTIENIGVVNSDITGDNSVGGLVGGNEGEVSESYATGSVSGDDFVGGLVGYNFVGEVSESYATGTVNGEGSSVGGLVGFNDGGEVSESYATGSVSGDVNSVGGLVGINSGEVSESYATGDATGEDGVGGIVGDNLGEVSESYATGSVTGDDFVGGLVGANSGGTVSDSYWDTESEILEDDEDVSEEGDGTGLTTADMQGDSSEDNMGELFPPFETVTDEYPILEWQE